MLQDIILAGFVVYCVIRAIRNPWVGILAWTLLSILNPHRFSWRFETMPLAAAVAVATLLGLVVSRDKKSFPVTPETVVLMALMAWFSVTMPFAFNVEGSFDQWLKVMKIDLMILAALVALESRRHIVALAWVLAISIGFYGVKGGIFTLAHGGQYRVWGPPGSYIEGNNELALALIAVVPILRFLQIETSRRWVKALLLVAMLLSVIAALGTHSRGALIAVVAMALMMCWRSERKVRTALLLAIAGGAIFAFMPEIWLARMESIGDYEDDGSAMGRINAWWMAWNLATHNFFGGGFDIYRAEVFARYAPVPDDIHAAHSIYFQILGEHGFVGLALFLLLGALVWMSAGRLRRQGGERPETRWLVGLGSMCQVSLVSYAVGGAFLSLAYFDLPYNVLVLVVLGRRWMNAERPTVENAAARPASIPPGASRFGAEGLR